MAEPVFRVLLVCLGNICRSPMADALLRHKLASRGLSADYEVDSAGTGAWHAGERPDPRTREVLVRHGVPVVGHARAVTLQDFQTFDAILAMDRSNLSNLRRMCPRELHDRLHLALEPTTGGEVPDPYYGEGDGFEHVYGLLDAALDGWIDRWTST